MAGTAEERAEAKEAFGTKSGAKQYVAWFLATSLQGVCESPEKMLTDMGYNPKSLSPAQMQRFVDGVAAIEAALKRMAGPLMEE
jgi:hypothetical protein